MAGPQAAGSGDAAAAWECPAAPSLHAATCSGQWATCSLRLASRTIETHVARVVARARRASRCADARGCEPWWRRSEASWLEAVERAERARLTHHWLCFDGQFLPNSTVEVSTTEGAVWPRTNVGGAEGTFGPFDYWEPEFSCAAEARVPVGEVGDGPKWVCGAPLLRDAAAPCRLVSLGSNFDDAFERGMAAAAGCESYVVDPTLRANPARLAAFATRLGSLPGSRLNTSVGVGVGTLDFRGAAHRLVGLGALLDERYGSGGGGDGGGSGPLRISVLKADIEGAEFDVLREVWQLCAAGRLAVDQLNVEVHLWRKALRFGDVHALFDGAKECGLAFHHKERNGWACKGWVCGEFSFVSLTHAYRVHKDLLLAT